MNFYRLEMRKHAMLWRSADAIAAAFEQKGLFIDPQEIKRQALRLAKIWRDKGTCERMAVPLFRLYDER